MGRNARLSLARMELAGAEARQRALEAEIRGAETRHRIAADMGIMGELSETADRTALIRMNALAMNAKTAEKLRKIIAECLAEAPDEVSAPIHAPSDDAALFDLLGSVGCRMPAGGAG